jgi:hypothetical protein
LLISHGTSVFLAAAISHDKLDNFTTKDVPSFVGVFQDTGWIESDTSLLAF